MKKVIVFGGSGFLGSYVADELTRRGYDVFVVDKDDPVYLKETQQFINCDIMDPAKVEAIVQDSTIVYNFAGLADIDECSKSPGQTIEQNVIGTINILEACKGAGLERFVYASSAYALSNKGGIYGISKLASEKLMEEYSRSFNIPFTIIRYGSLYGERAYKNNSVYNNLKEALTTRAIHHNGDGEEIREYIHASDAAVLSVDILEGDKYVNQHAILTGVERMRQRELLRMIQEMMNDEITITYSEKNRAGHYEVTPYFYYPNTAQKLVSSSFIDLEQGLVSCIKHLQDTLKKTSNEI